jgi:YesN/AraC family two-component response regulator
MVEKIKILIIDDEPLIRRALQKLFETDYYVETAVNGIEGLKLWELLLPDIVFIDVLMPVMTGPQVIDKVKTKVRDKTKVILMSAYEGDYNTSKMNIDLFLAKPFQDIFKVKELALALLNKEPHASSSN